MNSKDKSVNSKQILAKANIQRAKGLLAKIVDCQDIDTIKQLLVGVEVCLNMATTNLCEIEKRINNLL